MRKPLQEVDAEEGDGCLIRGGCLIRTLRYYCLDVWPHEKVSNIEWYAVYRPYICTYTQTKLSIKHNSVGLTHVAQLCANRRKALVSQTKNIHYVFLRFELTHRNRVMCIHTQHKVHTFLEHWPISVNTVYLPAGDTKHANCWS